MPHQCTHCGKIYDDGAKELLEGCPCGGKFFFYIKKSKFEKLKEERESILNLSKEDKQQIEDDVMDIIGIDKNKTDEPIILDIEAIKVSAPGKYELDLVKLMGDKPVVYKMGDGKYIIDLAQSFQNLRK